MTLKKKAFEVTQQLAYYDTSDPLVIVGRIKALTNLKTFCFVIHDKDLLDDKTPKAPHFHAILTFKNMTTSSVLSKKLKVPESNVQKIITNVKTAQLYLVHRNDPNKYQYNPKDVIANFDYVDSVDGYRPKANLQDLSDKIANWEIKQYNIYDFVSPFDYAKHKNFIDKCFIYRQWKMDWIERELECLYITGPSGVWKTTFAKMLATSKWYHSYVSSWGKNPLDDYKWEECIILDDLRDDVYEFVDLLKLTDNNTASLAGCRFYNKSIAECKLIIITSVVDIYTFYPLETYDSKKQLYRRIPTYAVMDEDKVTFYSYEKDREKYLPAFSVENPVSAMYSVEKNKKHIEWLISWMGLTIYDKEWEAKSLKMPSIREIVEG